MNDSSSDKKRLSSVEVNSTLARAYLLMERHQFPNLPVSSAGEVVGVISERDIETLIQNFSNVRSAGTLKTGNYMRSPVRSVDPNVRLDTVATLMIDERINAVILKKGDEVVGALTKDDLLKVFAELLKKTPHSVLEGMQALEACSTQRKTGGRKA
jgi:CBS domain-containing protein